MEPDKLNRLAEQYIAGDAQSMLYSVYAPPTSSITKSNFQKLTEKEKNLTKLELRMAAEELFLPSIDIGLINSGTTPSLSHKARNLILGTDHASSYGTPPVKGHTILFKVDNENHCITVYNSGDGVEHHHQHPSKGKYLTAQTFSSNAPTLKHMKAHVFGTRIELLQTSETVEEFYKQLEENFTTEAAPEEASKRWQSEQKHGNCGIQSCWAAAKDTLSDLAYNTKRKDFFETALDMEEAWRQALDASREPEEAEDKSKPITNPRDLSPEAKKMFDKLVTLKELIQSQDDTDPKVKVKGYTGDFASFWSALVGAETSRSINASKEYQRKINKREKRIIPQKIDEYLIKKGNSWTVNQDKRAKKLAAAEKFKSFITTHSAITFSDDEKKWLSTGDLGKAICGRCANKAEKLDRIIRDNTPRSRPSGLHLPLGSAASATSAKPPAGGG